MVLTGEQSLHSSRLKCPSKEWILSTGNADDMVCFFFPHQWLLYCVFVLYFCLFFMHLKIQIRKENQNGSNGSMITWDDFGCRSDVVSDIVSDVVQIAGNIQKFDILFCNRSKHLNWISNKTESDLLLNIMT
jgi:hypothetical protein